MEKQMGRIDPLMFRRVLRLTQDRLAPSDSLPPEIDLASNAFLRCLSRSLHCRC